MQWPRLGPQTLPTRLSLASPLEVAHIVGDESRFALATQRHAACAARFPMLQTASALSTHFEVLSSYEPKDFDLLLNLLSWLVAHPHSRHRPRQLPVAGLDTKWLEKRQAVVTDLLLTIRGESGSRDFYTVCGLTPDAHRLRVRVLCPELRAAVGSLGDIEAPLAELARLPVLPKHVLVIENLETGLALPDLPGCIAVMKLGKSVSVLAALPWVQSANVVYWGDIDTHGFDMLNQARLSLGEVTSVLMDEATLLTHRDLWVEEPSQCAVTDLRCLLERERMVFENLRNNVWGTKVRLEQERIRWADALHAVSALVGDGQAF
jgi:hypothetical protein